MNESQPPQPSPTCPEGTRRIALFLAWVALILGLGSRLIWSSPEYRERHLLVACVLAACFVRSLLWPQLRGMGRTGWVFGGGLLMLHAASWLGGVLHGQTLLAAGLQGLAGLIGVFGLAVFVVVLLQPRWRRYQKWSALGLLSLLLAGSYIGYFISIERYIELGQYACYFSDVRMALIWPTRLLTSSQGQIAWDHTNYAAFYFALGFVMLLEQLGGSAPRRAWYGWGLCGLLCAGVFLTGSRSGWLMIAVSLPLVLIRRTPWFALKTLLMMAVSISFGIACLKAKIALLPPAKEQPAPTVAVHSSDLVARGSAGRVVGYERIWQELEGSHLFGKGLAAIGQPVGVLTHEHSTYMATFRGGGLVALLGHGLVLGSAAWAALLLLLRGQRWPAVLLTAVGCGLLFDRSSIVALTGNYEFIAHWVAVLIPLLLLANCQSLPGTQRRG